jgi:hypothetical protein
MRLREDERGLTMGERILREAQREAIRQIWLRRMVVVLMVAVFAAALKYILS